MNISVVLESLKKNCEVKKRFMVCNYSELLRTIQNSFFIKL